MTEEITVTFDEAVDAHDKWARAEKDAASDAGTRRQEIGAFVEKHGLETKAFSQFRAGMKIKNEGKQRDWLRSMKILLGIAEQAITGNAPEMPLPEPEQPDTAEPEAPTGVEEQPADAETAEFNDAVDENVGDGEVVPFGEAS